MSREWSPKPATLIADRLHQASAWQYPAYASKSSSNRRWPGGSLAAFCGRHFTCHERTKSSPFAVVSPSSPRVCSPPIRGFRMASPRSVRLGRHSGWPERPRSDRLRKMKNKGRGVFRQDVRAVEFFPRSVPDSRPLVRFSRPVCRGDSHIAAINGIPIGLLSPYTMRIERSPMPVPHWSRTVYRLFGIMSIRTPGAVIPGFLGGGPGRIPCHLTDRSSPRPGLHA